ncbi:amino acid adenylation domain-containing protein [Bacillus subtilis]|uniref:amino acid adenylation domain-containing protein n=1 Tax=Bacillus subtilis TaxID=1423 RepID=UPI0030D4701A|nr:amino acid adenylation domain-containing protein [Bacillus subtilis]
MSIFNQQELFWNQVFDHEDHMTYLPYFKTSPLQTGNSKAPSDCTIYSSLSVECSQRVMTLTNQSPMAVYMILLAGVNCLLYKYTGNKNIIVGMPVLQSENQSLLNEILIVKNNLDRTSSFKKIFKQINVFVKEAIANQNIPFQKMVGNLNLQYDHNHLPKIDTIVSLNYLHSSHFIKTVTSDVRFEFYIENNLISLKLTYNENQYEREFMVQVTEHLNQIFSVILFQPDLEISQLKILSKLEENKILTEFNNTKANFQRDKTIHELFEEQVKRVPDQVAVEYEGQRLTYRQLNERANQLARSLREEGVKPDQLVGIMLERSLEMVIGILSILKAGGAYVPIDPEYPEDRIQYIFQDSNIKQLLTQRHLQERISFVGRVLYLDEECSYHEDNSNLENIVAPDNLAYVIYTSGTTGKPKGVMVEHLSVINTLMQLEKKYPLKKKDSILLKTNYTFDVSVTELFGWFFGQGRLVILKPNLEKDPIAISNIIQEKQITHINFVPSMLNVFLHEIKSLNAGKLKSLEYIFAAGEALPVSTIKQFYACALPAKLENIYGPTESTIYATQYTTSEDIEDYINTPIGKPLDSTKAYIINDDNQLQPVGLAGELCLSGVGLARGYLNCPDLTAEKFVNNPFASGERMYRTGDLVRWLHDGNIEYLGRIDHQVKIRGYRIEIGEVETALLNVEAIKEAVVIAHEDKHGNKSLCAYIVANQTYTVSKLKENLSDKLPSYMIPSYFIQLEQIPLTSNGKVNRKALSAPDENSQTKATYIAPRTSIEQALVTLWEAVLGVKEIGVLDNFYDLGGDSIKSIQVSSKLFQAGYKVEMKHLLKYPTIAQLSQHVQSITSVAEQGEITGTAPLTPIQLWFFKENLVNHYFNQAMMLYRRERFDTLILEQVMTQIIRHHDALRSVFVEQDNQFKVRIRGSKEGSLFSLEVFDLQDKEDVASIIETNVNSIQSSMNIEEGPLVKLGLFRCTDGDHLLIVIHHLVIDMVSWRILFEDLATGYEQVKNGKVIQLPPKTDSFKLWSERLFDYANGSDMGNESAYWNKIEQMVQEQLPKDYENEYVLNDNNDAITIQWTEQETEQLLKQANHAYNTEINDLLLTALVTAVHKWTGMQEVVVNLEGHGRETIIPDVNVTRTVGWFTSQYPVMLQVNPNYNVSERLKTVKEGLRQIPNKGIGYGILRYLSKSQGSIEYSMKPEISFNYLGQFDQDLVQNGLMISSYSSGSIMSEQTSRQYVLNINGLVQNGKLSFMIDYSKDQYRSNTIHQLAQWIKESLIEIIVHCVRKEETELTPSDLTLNGMHITELTQVIEHTRHIGTIEDIYELTPMQKGMLFHSKLDSSTGLYFEQMVFDLCGNLNVEAWVKSLEALMKRYSILRTNIYQGWNDTPLQIVYKHKSCQWLYEDLRGMNLEEREEYIGSFMLANKSRGFNLEKDTLLRVALLQTEDQTHCVVLSFHHILMDGWCIPIIMKEWLELYEALIEEKEAEHVMGTPYSRYIEWLSRQDKEAAANYWSEYLADYEEQIVIPYSKSNEHEEEYHTETVSCKLDSILTSQLQQIANRNQVTMNTVIQTLWGVLLQKYNNSEDVVFGSIVSGRPEEIPGIESMIGLFINTVPVRVRSEEGMTFAQLMENMRESAIASKSYDTYPLYEIQAQTEQKQALIDHIMVFENYPIKQEMDSDQSNETKLKVANFRGEEQTNYDFNFIVIPGNNIEVRFQYNANVYDRLNVKQIGNHLTHLMNQVVLNPDVLLERLSVTTEEETTKILTTFNDTKTEYPRDKTIQELFEEQAERTPDQIAVVYEGQQLTYGELNKQANQLARTLQTEGVEPDQLVGIMVERSLEMIVGILGILKAGGAYVPIDPDYPEERICYMLDDSGAKLLLSQSHLQQYIPRGRKVLYLDEQCSYHKDGSNLGNTTEPTHLAYVIYTSGTTGKPKGVMTEHCNIVRVVKNTNYIDITKCDTVMQLSSYAFDGATFDIFGALLNGAKIIIVPKETMLNVRQLADLIEKQHISVMFITTAFFNVLVDIDASCLKHVRKILFGGEQVSVKHVRKAFQYLGPNKIKHVYGPTESTVFATCYDVNELQDSAVNIPIGQPISNTTIYIVDNTNQLLPVGVAGEVCINGDGLARGYLNRPDITEEKFVDNPFVPGERMYRTGDLARWLPDGNIEYLGRIDHQVKIRGNRIEIGEVETALLNIREVQETVVIAREDENGAKVLCAYLVASRPYHVSEMKEKLSDQLPNYMIPSYFIQLEKMPLTSNGKIDRKALPVPEAELQTGKEYAAPRTPIEAKLAEIWQEVLDLAQVGVKDNFFDIGGHSLRATNLVAKIYKEMNVDVSLREVFSCPTIEQLAKIIQNSEHESYAYISTVEQREFYPVSSAQKRMYILNQLEGGEISYNIPSMLMIEGALDPIKLQSALVRLVDRHESLRTSFEIMQGELIQRIHANVDFSVNVQKVKQDEVDGYTRNFIRPFDLKQAPLFRVELLELELKKYILVVDMHHIISDGISRNVFMQDLFKLYEGEELPVLRIQYKDYAVWQRNELNQQHIKQQETYWLETLSGELPVLQIPTDYARPAMQDFKGDTLEFVIDEKSSEALRKLAAQTGTTLYMILLATYTMMLAKYSNQTDIIVGSPIAGRPNADLDRVVGMFVNTIVMRNYPEAEKTFINYLMEVKENALKAYENQHYQFEKLVEKLDVSRDMSRNAIFSVMFVLQNMDQDVGCIQSLDITPYKFEYNIAKFDLTLTAIEKGGQIHCMLEYATSLYKEQSVRLMMKHFIQLVNEITVNPQKKLAEISMIGEKEKTQILEEFNDTKTEYPKGKTIQKLFEEQAERMPDQLAVVCEGQQLTYGELSKRANQLARTLQIEGVEPDQLVGIMVERSLEMIVGILGTLKAGGAYVPIDPNYPEERIRYMLDDSGAKLLLSQSHLQECVPDGIKVLHLDEQHSYHKDGSNLGNTVEPTHLAYVIYTSGTTGKPKGVMIEHRNVVRLVKQTDYVELNEATRILQTGNIVFDASTFEIWGSLLNGGQLYLAPNERILNVITLKQLIERYSINTMWLTSPLFNQLSQQDSHLFEHLTTLIIGGDVLSVSHVNEVKRNYPMLKVVNGYGPTENTTFSTTFTISDEQINSVPIGRPISNSKAYIMDHSMQLQPVGVWGELVVAGDGVARGYLNLSDLTAEKFVDNPFAPGERMYRTGDLARWLPDGNIEYLGRIDHQVKIRGYRIEIGEVETSLSNIGEVQEAIVIAREDENGDKALYAYFVASRPYHVSEMKEKLSDQLPNYMIPSYFIQLEKMPLTPNGKIDRKALPVPEGELQTGKEYVAPRTPIEAKLAEIWQEVLGLAQVGVKDNFFNIGGHSIKILKLIQYMNEKMDVEINFQTIFYTPTIELMALQLMNTNPRLKDKTGFIPLNQNGEINVFCFPPPPGLGMIYLEMAKFLENECIVHVTDFIDNYDDYDEILNEYVDQITSIQNEGPYILLGYSGGGNLAFEVTKTMNQRGREVSDIIMLDTTPWNKKVQEIASKILAETNLTLVDAHELMATKYAENKRNKFLMYMENLTNSGLVKANIHNLVVDTTTTSLKKKWITKTSKEYIEYRGVGTHDELLNHRYIQENAGTIKQVLNEIKNKIFER